MRSTDHPARLRAAVREEDSFLFMALELSKSSWLIAASAPASEKVSKYSVAAADVAALLGLLARLKAQAEQSCHGPVQVVSIHEAGLDGFWVHRMLAANGVESHVVTPRRSR
jgi:transposase